MEDIKKFFVRWAEEDTYIIVTTIMTMIVVVMLNSLIVFINEYFQPAGLLRSFSEGVVAIIALVGLIALIIFSATLVVSLADKFFKKI